jgi:trans-2-enoyl-CoA reductase
MDEKTIKEAQKILRDREIAADKARMEREQRERRESRERRDAEITGEVRKIFPEVTREQFSELADIFDTYFRWFEL